MPRTRPAFRTLPLALLLAWPAAPAPTAAAEPEQPSGAFPYSGAGPFVIVPGRFFSAPVYGAGFAAGALLCAPISLIQDPRMEGKVKREKQASLACGGFLGTAVGWPVYAAAGLPFFLLKLLFWDAPRMVFGKKDPEPA